jgi:hypothetical protein
MLTMAVFVSCIVLEVCFDKELAAGFLPELNRKEMDSISSLLVFFTVFRNANSYSRFYSQADHSKQVSATIREVAYFAKSKMMLLDKNAAANLVRLANLCHLCAYIGLSPQYNGETFVEISTQYNLLTKHEEACLDRVWEDEAAARSEMGVPNTRIRAKSESARRRFQKKNPDADTLGMNSSDLCDGPQGYQQCLVWMRSCTNRYY